MSVLRAWLLLPLLCGGVLAAADKGSGQMGKIDDAKSPEESEEDFIKERRKSSADFRIARSEAQARLSEDYERRAAAARDEVQALMDRGRIRAAWELADTAYDDYRYSRVAPELGHVAFRYFAATGRLPRAHRIITDIWERYPEYPGVAEMLREAILVAEHNQARNARINLDASDPRRVVELESLGEFLAGDGLLRFLARIGDDADIAPRARIALARSSLVQGGKDSVLQARLAYDEFLNRYPQHPLAFRALAELAVSHLVTYRGPRYDVGVLIEAAAAIDLAELYQGQDTERQALVRRLRAVIRRWHQERDLYSAGWYSDKDYNNGARYYLQEVVRRDPESTVGREAARRLAAMPPETGSGTGTTVGPRPAGEPARP
jgi:hypothetical protein